MNPRPTYRNPRPANGGWTLGLKLLGFVATWLTILVAIAVNFTGCSL